MFEFRSFEFTIVNFIDIFFVAVLLFSIYRLLRGTVAINIFIGLLIVFLIYKITEALHMTVFSSLLRTLVGGSAISLIIIFHPEMRKFLLMLGSTNLINGERNFIKQLKFLRREVSIDLDIKSLLNACQKFSSSKTGAIIVISRTSDLEFIKETGDFMNIELNIPILESIFYKNSPLHDGAIVVKKNFITATRVVLPLSDRALQKKIGLRHRAAVGITERTDAMCLVVSEETGIISFFIDGIFEEYSDMKKLNKRIKVHLS